MEFGAFGRKADRRRTLIHPDIEKILEHIQGTGLLWFLSS